MKVLTVTGISTDVGKTVVSAILAEALSADYWKPIQAGNLEHSDTKTIQKLVSNQISRCHPEAFCLQHPLSPHHAARLEGLEINAMKVSLPSTKNTLVVEGAGGLMVPLNATTLMIDLFAKWQTQLVLVSKHYLGSINHTLLSIEAMKSRALPIMGIVFNGEPNPDTENLITGISEIPMIGRLEPEPFLNASIIKKYAALWKPLLEKYVSNKQLSY
jgi:dethiobiotin synthetase